MSLVPVVDYTSRDFASLRQDLLNAIPSYLPEWTNRSDNDFGVVLLDLFAYTADGLHYYMDRVANEAYLDTASKRSSVLKIAKLLGYVPTGNTAAEVSLTFFNSAGANYTVPAGTKVSTQSTATSAGLVFETDSAVLVTAGGNASVTAHQGQTVTAEAIGTSNGLSAQSFALQQSPVIDGSVAVTVTVGATSRTWAYAEHLLDYGAGAEVFTVETDATGISSVVFGDNVNGSVPNNAATITATYRVGGGVTGNVPANTITSTYSSGLPGTITVNNQAAAFGGADAESTDEIRSNAPASLTSLRRAITVSDYADVALSVVGVARARAVATATNSVLVYIAPVGGGGVVSGTPTTAFAALLSSTQSQVQAKAPATVTVTAVQPTYAKIDVSATVYLTAGVPSDAVQVSCEAAIRAVFDFENVNFGDVVTPTSIHRALGGIAGVEYVTITLLDRDGNVGTGPVSLSVNEIPVLDTLTLTYA